MLNVTELYPASTRFVRQDAWDGLGEVGWQHLNRSRQGQDVAVVELPDVQDWDAYGQSSFIDRTNYDYLIRTYPELVRPLRYVNTNTLLVAAELECTCDGPDTCDACALYDDLARLADYPILDEDELARREWTEWAASWEPDGYNHVEFERALGRSVESDEDVARMHRVIEDTFQGETEPDCTYPSESYEELAARFHALALDDAD